MKTLAGLGALLSTDLRDVFKRGHLIDDGFLAELESVLVRAGVEIQDVQQVVEKVRRSHYHRVVRFEEVLADLQVELAQCCRQ